MFVRGRSRERKAGTDKVGGGARGGMRMDTGWVREREREREGEAVGEREIFM